MSIAGKIETAEESTTIDLSGGAAIARMLELAGVGPMFGMGGFQLLPFYEAIRKSGLTHHLINDERAGAFAADAYARITNRPGVCDATLGPGATNLVTGLVESLNAGVPQVVFTGDTHRDHSWKNMTQEARQVEILRPAVKEIIRVERVKRIPEIVRRAFAVATSGRPGPVVVDVPEDIAHETFAFPRDDLWIDQDTTRTPSRRSRPDPAKVARAADIVRLAARPLLLVGGGIHLSQGYAALETLAESQFIPVAHSISGKGGLACSHPLSAGLFGRYSRIANDLIGEADCLIVVGCKLGEVATRRYQLIPAGVPIIHLDTLAEEIGRTSRADVALAGDATLGLTDLNMALEDAGVAAHELRADYVAEVQERMATWRKDSFRRLNTDERPISVARLMTELNRSMPAESVLVTDGGFAAHWGGLLFDTKKAGRHFIADRGFASIGYGLPAAIGAKLADPSRPVVAITGDGGCNMTLGELETARRAGAGITLIVINNAASGYVKALQHAVYDGSCQSSDLTEMDYSAIAREFGCEGIRVEDPADLATAIASGVAGRSVPTVIDVVVTRDPSKMLPGVDNRTLQVKTGDRPV